MTYEEQLLTPQWKAKRQSILKRDKYKCKNCGSTNNLNVHHKKYIKSKLAWQYQNYMLITLCRECHKGIHGLNDIVVNIHINICLDQVKERKETNKKLSKDNRIINEVLKSLDKGIKMSIKQLAEELELSVSVIRPIIKKLYFDVKVLKYIIDDIEYYSLK